MTISEVAGIDKARRTPAWKVFAGLASLSMLVTSGRQLWRGDKEWIVTKALDELWAVALTATTWTRTNWQDGGPAAFIPVLAVIGLLVIVMMMVRSVRKWST